VRKSILILFVFGNMIANAQNMGIGTTNPTRSQLEVIGVSGTGKTTAIFGNGLTGISFQQNWPTFGFNQYRDAVSGNGKYMENGYAAIMYQDPGTGTIAFDLFGSGLDGTTTTLPVRGLSILNNGYVGIQTPTPPAALAVGRGTGFDGTAVFAGIQHWSHFNYADAEHTYIRSGKNNGKLVLNNIPNGNVFFGNGNSKLMIGLAINEPNTTVHIAGINPISIENEIYNHFWNMRFERHDLAPPEYFLNFYYSVTQKGRFNWSFGTYQPLSDSNAKENIRGLTTVLDKVNQLKPVSYEMINHNPLHKRSLGFIAQEVKHLFPQIVRVVNDQSVNGPRYKDLHSMNYSAMHVIAIKALQEQYLQIIKLRQEREGLMNELRSLAGELGIK